VMVEGELEEDFNEESDEHREDWIFESDVAGKVCWPDQERELMDEMLETGDALLLECQRKESDRLIPLCYQVLEAEQLDESRDRPRANGQTAIIRGIEVDDQNVPINYWLFDAHPEDPYQHYSPKSRPVPARRVIHLAAPGRPSQTRGMSLYAKLTQPARDIDTYLGSELTAAIIGSLLTVIHKVKNGGAALGFKGDGSTGASDVRTDEYGNPLVKLARGIVSRIPADDDITVVDPKRPNQSAESFIRLMLTQIGMGGNVSRQRLTRDYTGNTFLAARAARLDDQAAFRPLQFYVGRNLLMHVHRRVTAQLAAYGRFKHLTARTYASSPRRWNRADFLFPGIPEIDVEKGTDALLAQLAAGLITHKEACATFGRKYRRVLKQRAREVAMIAKLEGLQVSYDRPSTPGGGRKDEKEEAAAGEES